MKECVNINGVVYFNDGGITDKWKGMAIFRDDNGYYSIKRGRKFNLRPISGADNEYMVIE